MNTRAVESQRDSRTVCTKQQSMRPSSTPLECPFKVPCVLLTFGPLHSQRNRYCCCFRLSVCRPPGDHHHHLLHRHVVETTYRGHDRGRALCRAPGHGSWGDLCPSRVRAGPGHAPGPCLYAADGHAPAMATWVQIDYRRLRPCPHHPRSVSGQRRRGSPASGRGAGWRLLRKGAALGARGPSTQAETSATPRDAAFCAL